ncbi:unnamed protein product [Ceutorhynchus assimilis]|uniref:Uncharacterized protein n=1 Tax=Ceutorhynchus assimilis TaxID=467358 RepID=A0A9N9MEX9_9CUCU|nr:unnamed protein product [Ceutorhynchus assimilis]
MFNLPNIVKRLSDLDVMIQNQGSDTISRMVTLEQRIIKVEQSVDVAGKSCRDPAVETAIGEREELIFEMMERKNRASNILVYNVTESKMNTQTQRMKEDSETVERILENFNIDKNKLSIYRLEKFIPNKNRPIKVCLAKEEDANCTNKTSRQELDDLMKIGGDIHNDINTEENVPQGTDNLSTGSVDSESVDKVIPECQTDPKKCKQTLIEKVVPENFTPSQTSSIKDVPEHKSPSSDSDSESPYTSNNNLRNLNK